MMVSVPVMFYTPSALVSPIPGLPWDYPGTTLPCNTGFTLTTVRVSQGERTRRPCCAAASHASGRYGLPRPGSSKIQGRYSGRKVPRVDGALTTQPRTLAVLPVRNTSASSMQSPPASADATRVTILSPVFARRVAQVEALLDQLGQTQVLGQGGGKDQPGIVDQAVVIKGDLDAVGLLKW